MRVLLVDHDSEGLEAIARAIRGVLELDCVSSKGDALLLLRQNTYDVLIACERCVDGSGLDLLGRTTRTAVPLKRIFAAAPERLQLLGPRLAPFKVQRTINYPIDLEELWLAIAQVTGGPNDETDGTIERVVLDERGIPSNGSTPRAPIPSRPPAPLAVVPPPPAPSPAVAASSSGRFATARAAQPAPEPPLRAPPPPRAPPQVRVAAPPASTAESGRMRVPAQTLPPASPAESGRMRAPAPPVAITETGRMRALAPPVRLPPPMPPQAPLTNGGAHDFPSWTPEPPVVEDDFAEIAEQARFGVQQKAVDEASRRRMIRVALACGIAVAVAGGIVFLFEKFYDPDARAREEAIATEVQRMSDQQKVTDDLTHTEIDIENAIMNNELDKARSDLARLVAKSPNHPRREFLAASIERAAELAKLAGLHSVAAPPPTQPPAVTPAAKPEASRPHLQASIERVPTQSTRSADRGSSAPRSTAPTSQRVYGAPIGEAPRPQSIPLNSPINSPPAPSTRNTATSFGGRTVEASDAAGNSAPQTQAASPSAVAQTNSGGSAAPQPQASVPTNVVPARLVKRVTPVAPMGVSRKTSGFVLVRYVIGENGKVGEVEIVDSQPQGVFDDAAQNAVRKWVYEPRTENGVAVSSTAQAKLIFQAE